MRNQIPRLPFRVLLILSLLTFPAWPAAAQVAKIPTRITQAVDEKNLVALPGNVHPLARPEFDLGLVADAHPMKRMLLLLRRSADQEAALQTFLDEQ